MAKKVTAQVSGGQAKVLEDIGCVADARRELGLGKNYTATVNGEPAADSTTFRDFDYVSFAEAVKGA